MTFVGPSIPYDGPFTWDSTSPNSVTFATRTFVPPKSIPIYVFIHPPNQIKFIIFIIHYESLMNAPERKNQKNFFWSIIIPIKLVS